MIAELLSLMVYPDLLARNVALPEMYAEAAADATANMEPAAENPAPSPSPSQLDGPVQADAYDALAAMGRADEWPCMADIFEAESTWNPDGVGDTSIGGSVGLGQRHIPVWGDPRPWTVAEQVVWFTDYADDRYGGWCEARDRWAARSSSMVDGRMVGGWW